MRTAHVCGPSQIRLRARCFRNPTHVMNCSYGVQLIVAVAAYSWLQSRGLTLSVSLHMETGKARPRGRGSDGRADPTTRPTFPQFHACCHNYMARMCAVLEGSPQSRSSRTAHITSRSRISDHAPDVSAIPRMSHRHK